MLAILDGGSVFYTREGSSQQVVSEYVVVQVVAVLIEVEENGEDMLNQDRDQSYNGKSSFFL